MAEHYRADHVGSLLRPPALLEARAAHAAGRIGLSESATKSAIYRLRQRYGQLFADEIAQTVGSPEDVDDEIRHLLAVLEAC